MSYLITAYLRGATQQDYEKIRDEIVRQTGNGETDGNVSHTAGPTEGGWLVAEVWESKEAWERFQRDLLKPAFEKTRVKDDLQLRTAEALVHEIE